MEGIGRKEVTMSRNRRIRFENTIISIIALASLALLILSFLPSLPVSEKVQVSLEMGKMVQRAFSIVLLAASLQQMKRKRVEWCIAVLILCMNFVRCFSGFHHPAHLVIMAGDRALAVAFVHFREDFRNGEGISRAKGIPGFELVIFWFSWGGWGYSCRLSVCGQTLDPAPHKQRAGYSAL